MIVKAGFKLESIINTGFDLEHYQYRFGERPPINQILQVLIAKKQQKWHAFVGAIVAQVLFKGAPLDGHLGCGAAT